VHKSKKKPVVNGKKEIGNSKGKKKGGLGRKESLPKIGSSFI
jgi:hypothetical protein